MAPSTRPSPSLLASATLLLCATVAASDVHLPSFISDSGVSRPQGNNGGRSRLRGGGGDGGSVQLDDADAPHDWQDARRGDGDDFQCNAEPHTDYGGPIAFVWVSK
jgi:hypothetical protein